MTNVRPQRSNRRGTTSAFARRAVLWLALASFASLASAQTQVRTDIRSNQAAQLVPIAIPFPALSDGVTSTMIYMPFFNTLTRDLSFSGVFSIVALPPNVPPSFDTAKAAGAQELLKLKVSTQPPADPAAALDFVVEARIYDVSGREGFGKRYRGPDAALTKMAHLLSNDLVRAFNGKPGIFLTQIAFVSDRDGHLEIYLMDYDGGNQRRITFHNSISILPSWAPDDERIVYTAFARGASEMYIINRRGGGRIRLNSGLALNTSATFSPLGNEVAFVGSVAGNPDIYVIRDDGTNLRRLTTEPSIESTPEWSPNGRQIAFTSSRGGTPQIYLMDAEGTNVRRISFEGNWNDDAVFSPDGGSLAYTSRVNGRFQIRIMDLATGQSRIIAGEGSNEQPSFSPDGRFIVFQSNRTGRWQIYRIGVDGMDLVQLTTAGENKDPDWSKRIEPDAGAR
jgi:TolB protein